MTEALGRRLLVSAMLASIAGCSAPVEIEKSNKDASYNKKIVSVLVIMAMRTTKLTAGQNDTFVTASELKQSLAAAWAPLGISFEVVDLNAGQSTVTTSMRVPPQQFLTLKLEHITLASTAVVSFAIDASLTDVSTKRRVWRTSVQFNNWTESGRVRGTGSNQNDADDLARVLTAKLKEDGLL